MTPRKLTQAEIDAHARPKPFGRVSAEFLAQVEAGRVASFSFAGPNPDPREREPGDDDDLDDEDEDEEDLVPVGAVLEAVEISQRIPGVRVLSTAKLESISWLWRNWLARKSIAFVEGDPGLGKSTLVVDIAARVSNGAPMPDGSPGIARPSKVLFLLAEDTASTVRARLEAAGANTENTVLMDFIVGPDGQPRQIMIPNDIPQIERAVRVFGVELVVIDPWFAFVDEKVDTHGDQSSRKALTPMMKMAEATNTVVIGLRHWNKGKGSAMQRGMGSVAHTAAARTVLTVGVDPGDEKKCVLACVKTNLGPKPKSLGYSMLSTVERPDGSILEDDLQRAVETNRVQWHGDHLATATDLAMGEDVVAGASAIDEACAFLRDAITTGTNQAKALQKLARDAGIAWPTVKRAKKKLDVVSEKQQFSGEWVWHLPEDDQGNDGSHETTPNHRQGSKGIKFQPPHSLDPLDPLRDQQGDQAPPFQTLIPLLDPLRVSPRERERKRDEGDQENLDVRARARGTITDQHDHMDHMVHGSLPGFEPPQTENR